VLNLVLRDDTSAVAAGYLSNTESNVGLRYMHHVTCTTILGSHCAVNRWIQSSTRSEVCRHRWLGIHQSSNVALELNSVNVASVTRVLLHAWNSLPDSIEFTMTAIGLTRSPASAGIANRPLVFATRTTLSGHTIEYLCLNLFTLRRFNNNESSGGRQIRFCPYWGVMPPD